MNSPLSTEKHVRHATRSEDSKDTLCGKWGKSAKPGDTVNCPDCRVAINHVQRNYDRSTYINTTLTKEQKREAAEAMYRDLVLGEVND